MLWQGGNVAAARRWLETIIAEFPSTEVAGRAQMTLARLD